jgi:steroid delta-isomerase-like uncharacterized protein
VGNLEDCERNKAVIRQLPGVLDTLDRAAIGALFTEDFQLHESKFPEWPRGHEGAFRLLVMMRSLMPDMTIRIEDMFGEGDKVCVRWRYSGTLTGAFENMKGDGSRYEAVAFGIYRFRDGRIAEDWGTAARLPDGHPWRTD